MKLTAVSCAPVVEVKIKRPDTKYQLGFSVQNGVVSHYPTFFSICMKLLPAGLQGEQDAHITFVDKDVLVPWELILESCTSSRHDGSPSSRQKTRCHYV